MITEIEIGEKVKECGLDRPKVVYNSGEMAFTPGTTLREAGRARRQERDEAQRQRLDELLYGTTAAQVIYDEPVLAQEPVDPGDALLMEEPVLERAPEPYVPLFTPLRELRNQALVESQESANYDPYEKRFRFPFLEKMLGRWVRGKFVMPGEEVPMHEFRPGVTGRPQAVVADWGEYDFEPATLTEAPRVQAVPTYTTTANVAGGTYHFHTTNTTR